MYTVILYLEDEEILIEKYKFIFSSFQEDNQLYLFPWKNEKMINIVNVLNEITQSRQEWKLIVYGGMNRVTGSYLERSMNEEVKKLIQLYSGMDSGENIRVMGRFPEYVYYVVSSVRQPVLRRDSELFVVDSNRIFGSNFRMFRFELDVSCEKNKQFDLFRLNCALLALAVNRIPSGVTEYGYLYYLDIDIDQDLFSKFIREQEQKIVKIRKLLEIESGRLQNVRKAGAGYPPPIVFKHSLKSCRDSLQKSGNIVKFKRRNLRDNILVSDKLEENKKWVRSRLYFPKGMLREEASKIQEMVENERGVDDFLSAAGQDVVERGIKDKLEEICKKRTVQLQQNEFLFEFRKKEETIRQCAQKKMSRGVKIVTCFILSIIEMVMLFPFIYYSWISGDMVDGGNLIYKVLDMARQGIENVGIVIRPGIWYLLVFAGVLLGVCILFIFAIVWVLGTFYEKWILYDYHRHLLKEMDIKQRQKIDYFEEIVNLLAEYQYYIRLLREQKEREERWEAERQMLGKHRNVWKQSYAVCQQIKSFLNEGEEFTISETISVNVHEEPRKIEYYWIPFKDNQGIAELNRSGYYIKVLFYFIARVYIQKQYAERYTEE